MSDDLYRPDLPPIGRPAIDKPPADEPVPLDFDDEPIDPEDAAVLAELQQMQHQRPSWWGAIGLLVVSLLLYMGLSRTERAWDGILLFVPVLAFHELGHYVTMRFFGYRNLRMFFIPFFGAAVSGRHYNIEGWKKAVVALMGPVPGILLALPLGTAGLSLEEPLLVQAAMLVLILNGFNLLPFLPLDGGWVMHAVLFVRHPLLDIAFRLLAALALLGIAFLLGSWILGITAALMLLGLPLAWRLARIAYDLRRQGVTALSLEADSIPPETALPILAELRQVLPQQTMPRVLAQHVASVFETLNAHPPGVLASLGLLIVHAGSFLAALVLAVVFAMLHHPPG